MPITLALRRQKWDDKWGDQGHVLPHSTLKASKTQQQWQSSGWLFIGCVTLVHSLSWWAHLSCLQFFTRRNMLQWVSLSAQVLRWVPEPFSTPPGRALHVTRTTHRVKFMRQNQCFPIATCIPVLIALVRWGFFFFKVYFLVLNFMHRVYLWVQVPRVQNMPDPWMSSYKRWWGTRCGCWQQ